MADLKAYGSMGSTGLKGFLARLKEEIEFVPIGIAAGQKALYSFVDPFSEVTYVVEEEDGDFKLPGSNLKHEKQTGPINVKALNILRPTVVVVPVRQIVKESMEKAGVLPKLYPSCVSTVNLGEDSPSKYMGVENFELVDSLQPHVKVIGLGKYMWVASKYMGVESFELVDSLQPHVKVIGLGKYMGVESYELVDSLQPYVKAKCFCIGLSKYMGVESFELVDSLQPHVKAKCCCFGLSKYMGVDNFEHSCVDVHACYKGTLPWPAPRGPRISKLSRTDTAAAAPAPSRPFSFRASLTLSLSVFFE